MHDIALGIITAGIRKMIQSTVFLITIVLMAVVILGFAYVGINASKPAVEYPPLQSKAYGIRSALFWLLLIAGVIITVITTLDLPYAATRGELNENALQIDVEGSQWFWKLSQDRVSTGQNIVFNVTATDVNHGLAVYDPQMNILSQTQAMPGYTNSLELTLDEPGEYQLMCMEYCGTAHHAMVSKIQVTE